MTYYLPENRALYLRSEHLGKFASVTFNNRISAKLSSKKKKKAEEGRKNCLGSLLSLMEPEPPLGGVLVFLFDLFSDI